jgi:hypothetical protein
MHGKGNDPQEAFSDWRDCSTCYTRLLDNAKPPGDVLTSIKSKQFWRGRAPMCIGYPLWCSLPMHACMQKEANGSSAVSPKEVNQVRSIRVVLLLDVCTESCSSVIAAHAWLCESSSTRNGSSYRCAKLCYIFHALRCREM